MHTLLKYLLTLLSSLSPLSLTAMDKKDTFFDVRCAMAIDEQKSATSTQKVENSPIKIKNFHKPLFIIGVPGQKCTNAEKNGGCYAYLLQVLFVQNHDATVFVSNTPQYNDKTVSDTRYNNTLKRDLGQNNCQTCLKQTIDVVNEIAVREKSYNGTYDVLFYGQSQGTATVLNFIDNLVKEKSYCQNIKPHEFMINNNKMKIKGIILEGAIATGNSTMYHSVTHTVPALKYIPAFYHWLPYAANLFGGYSYNPHGQQPIDSIQKIPKKIPIIIAHGTQDNITPYSGSQVLYYARKVIAGAHNTYHISTEGKGHEWLFDRIVNYKGKIIPERDIIRHIPEIHALLNSSQKQDKSIIKDMKAKYQPNSSFGKEEYESLLKREMRN